MGLQRMGHDWARTHTHVNFMKHRMNCPYITEQNMRFLQGFNLPDCRISSASLIHSASRQFHLNSINCQSKRATGPYWFPQRCLSPCYGMITACLHRRQLLLLSEKKNKKPPSGQPNHVSLTLTYFRAWSSCKPGPNPTTLRRADALEYVFCHLMSCLLWWLHEDLHKGSRPSVEFFTNLHCTYTQLMKQTNTDSFWLKSNYNDKECSLWTYQSSYC